jgi:hypothetical protein
MSGRYHNIGNSQSYNPYSYCLNNPLKYTDPTGYDEAPYYRPGVAFGYTDACASGYMGPGSGNHWSDQYSRSEFGNFMLMSGSTFINTFGSDEYNKLVNSTTNSATNTTIFAKILHAAERFSSYLNDGYTLYPNVQLLNAKYNVLSIGEYGSIINENGSVCFSNSSATAFSGYLGDGFVNATSGAGLAGWVSDAMTGIGGFGLANSAKTELIDYAVRSSYKSASSWSQFNNLRSTQQAWRMTNTLSKTGADYLKFAKGLGYVGAGITTAYSVTNMGAYYYNGGTDMTVLAKSSLDIIMTGVGFIGPIGLGISAAYFILDASTDGFGGFGQIKP